jgi:hypothetical protein
MRLCTTPCMIGERMEQSECVGECAGKEPTKIAQKSEYIARALCSAGNASETDEIVERLDKEKLDQEL